VSEPLDRVLLRATTKWPGTVETALARHRRYQLQCAPTVPPSPPLELALLSLDEARNILADPMRDMAYLETRLGPDVADFLRWKRQSNASPRTLDSLERYLARLAVELPAGVGIADISIEHLMLVLDGIPPKSWKKVRSHYRTFIDWAIAADRRGAKNPVGQLPTLLGQNNVPVYKTFTETERDLIVQAARHMDIPVLDRARALLQLDGPFRKGELCGIRCWDIDPVDRVVTVTGKGDKQNVVPIRGPFWLAWEHALLEPLPRTGCQLRPDDYVWFPARVAGAYKNRERQVTAIYPDRPMGSRGFHEWWGRLIAHSGVTYRNPHMTRHTYATDALDASDGDLYGVSKLLNHASTKTTEIYLHSSRRRKESVADKLGRVRRGLDA
jgi:site-specific recombinase XerD